MSTAHEHGQAYTRVIIEIEVIDPNNEPPLWKVTIRPKGEASARYSVTFTDPMPDTDVMADYLREIIEAAPDLPLWLKPRRIRDADEPRP